MIKKFTILLFFIIFIFSISCEKIPTPFSEKFEESYPIEKEVLLSIENFNGSVTITKWSENSIYVQAEKKSLIGKEELNKVEIEVVKNNEFKINSVKLTTNPKVAITYNIKVPEKVILKDIITSNGNIEIVDLRGDSNLKSSNGYIKVINHIGKVSADTSNGRIEVTNLTGNVNLITSNGKILVDGCERVIQAETSNASIEIKRAKEIGDIKTSNGRIDVEVYKIREGGVRILTSNASIYTNIKSDLNINIEAMTSNGEIDVKDLNLSFDISKKTHIEGRLNNGGDTLSIKTSNSNIYLSSIP